MSANNTTLNNKSTLTLLSIVSLIWLIVAQLPYFFYYTCDYLGSCYITTVYTLSFKIDAFSLICSLIAILPCVLFLLYVLKLHEKMPPAIVFGSIIVQQLLFIIIFFIYGHGFTRTGVFCQLVVLFAATWALFGSNRGFKNRISIIVPMALSIFTVIYDNYRFIVNFVDEIRYYLDDGHVIYIFSTICGLLGPILFYLALLIYGLTNSDSTSAPAGDYDNYGGYSGYSDCSNGGNSYGGLTYTSSESSYEAPSPIATVSATTTTTPDTPKCDPMKELTELKANLQNGTISQEEYDSRLADIMSKI